MNLKIYQIKLEEEKRLLEKELGALGKIDATGNWKAVPENEMNHQEVQDSGDLADRSEDFEERSSKLDLLELRLSDVKIALVNINKDNYGYCENCKKSMAEDGLEVNPAE